MPEEATPFGGRVVRGVDALLHIAARFGERLAHLARHDVGEFFLAGRQQVAHATQYVTTRRRRRALPDLVAAASTGHRRLDVGGAGGGEQADQITLISGIAVLEVGAGGRGNPLAANEVLVGGGHAGNLPTHPTAVRVGRYSVVPPVTGAGVPAGDGGTGVVGELPDSGSVFDAGAGATAGNPSQLHCAGRSTEATA